MASTDPGNIELRRADTLTLDIEPAEPPQENALAVDYYEILRVGPQADEDTIERVYRTLADRFHPDNPSTGDPDTFLRLREAYETLSDRSRRAQYNVVRRDTRSLTRYSLRGREFFDGVRGGQNRRLAVLCLLYRQRISNHEWPALTILDLEHLTGYTREELTAALWYLCEKKWSTIGEFSAYSITVDGFDVVESKLEERLEFRALATMRYYGVRAELEESTVRKGALPLDIEPALNSDDNIFIADHYEILGIGPQADQETIDRVYRTLAARFHPDNPLTGDAKAFLRIREAHDTLSDQGRREQYDAHRQRTRYSERFRLRGREFFDGVRGEQLRRLAVLCLLYRQAASELPGLTVLDLEQLTGCTREELGPGLWYLREKKWARYGEFTEYSITAEGFDVVENKLDDQEAARSQAWLGPEDARSNEFVYPQVRAAQLEEQKRQLAPAAPYALIAKSAESPENRNSHLVVESHATEIHIEEPLSEPMELAQGQAIPENMTRLEEPAEAVAEEYQVIPVEAPFDAETLFVRGTSPIEESSDIAERVTRIEVIAQQLAHNRDDVPAALQFLAASTAIGPDNWNSQPEAEELPAEAPAPTVEALPVLDAIGEESQPGVPSVEPQSAKPEAIASEIGSSSLPITKREFGANPRRESGTLQGFVRRLFGLGSESGGQSRENVPIRRQNRMLNIAPETWSPQIIVNLPPNVDEDSRTDELPALTAASFAIEPEVVPAEKGTSLEAGAESAVPVESEPIEIKSEEPPEQDVAFAPAPAPIEEASDVVDAADECPGVSSMNDSKNAIAPQTGGAAVSAEKRVILSMGGKGGVGKTSVMTGLAEWFDANQISVTLLDLDTENKAKGSLTHFFGGRVPKINIHTPAGLDAFIDQLAADARVILADMGAGAGKVTHDWFDKMYPDVAEAGVVFTAVGVVTSDPASVESILNWAAALQDRVSYVIVENHLTEHADFSYWQESEQGQEFRKRFQPAIVRMDYRLADLENAARNYGVTLGQIAGRSTPAPELQKASLVMRAQSYRRRMFAEFDKVREMLLP